MSGASAARPAGGATSDQRLSPGARKAILSVHVFASVAVIGVTGSVLLLALRAAGAAHPAAAHPLYTSIQLLAFALAIPFSLISLATGTALGLGTQWGLLRHRWVTAKLALQFGILATGAVVVGPATKELVDASGTAHSMTELGSARYELSLAGALNLAMAATAVGLAVYKPRRRRRH